MPLLTCLVLTCWPSTLSPQPIFTLDSSNPSHLAGFHCCSHVLAPIPLSQAKALRCQPCRPLLPWDLAHAPERCQ